MSAATMKRLVLLARARRDKEKRQKQIQQTRSRKISS